jgi:hypothetical protein
MRLVSFGGVALPEGGGETSTPLSARSALITMPGGGFDQDGAELYLEPRTITRRMIITDDIDDTLDTLLGALGRGRSVLVAKLRDDVTRRQTWAKMTGVEREMKPGYIGQQPVVITFTQDYPFWLATDDEPIYLDAGEVLDDGWVLDTGHVEVETVASSPHTFTLTNTGVVRLHRGTLTVTPGTSLTNLRIENTTNGSWLAWLGTLAATDTLMIDLLTRTVQLNGVDDYAAMVIPTDAMDWLPLEVGANVITVTCSSLTGNATLRWQWARHYL